MTVGDQNPPDTETTYSPPYDVRWPTALLQPTDVHEFVTACYLVHEAAHAVVALEFRLPIVQIWARRPDHPGGVEFDAGAPLAGDPAALVALASRVAVYRYLRMVGHDNPQNIASLEEMFEHDDRDAAEWAEQAIEQLRPQVADLVDARWGHVLELAQRLGDAEGHLTRADLDGLYL